MTLRHVFCLLLAPTLMGTAVAGTRIAADSSVAAVSSVAVDSSVAAASSVAVASSVATPAKTPVTLKPTSQQLEAAQLSARFLTRFHYDAQPLDDAMSKKIFTAYLKDMDGDKLYFTQADVDKFAPLRTQLDDAIWNQNLSGPFAMFNLYIQRSLERMNYARGLLKKGFDFTGEGTYNYDRKNAKWAASEKQLNDIWRRRVMNDWMRLKLAGQDDATIRKVLYKRYTGYIDRIRQLDGEDAFQLFMNSYAMTTDPHTDYLGPRAAENFAINMRLSLEGIGAVLQARDEYTMIRSVVPGGPAEKSGKVHPGDRIVGVGQGAKGPIQDVIGWRLDDVVDKIRGKKNTDVRLEVLPAKSGLDGKHETITLVRKKVTIAEQAAKKKLIQVNDGGVTRRIGVIDLPSFYEDFAARSGGDPNFKSASRDVAKLIKELKQDKVDGIVVDLRSDGGGSLSEAVALTGLFIKKGPVVQVRKSNGDVEEDADKDPGMLWSGPLAVLVNRGSASASEIFTAAIKDYGRGVIIGEPTFGKGTVQNLVDLDRFGSDPGEKPTYGELKMTIAEFFRITGGSTQLRGVTPDIEFPKNGDAKDFGESTYDNALPWTHIAAAQYKPVADLSTLVPLLQAKHKARAAKSPAWKLLDDELALFRQKRLQTTVSLNYAKREAERKQFEAQQKSFAARHKAIDGDSDDQTEVDLDDGLQPGERSLKSELKDESDAKKAKDVMLNEAAHIVSDEVGLIHAKPKLAAQVLPYGGKFTSGLGTDASVAVGKASSSAGSN